MFVKKLNAINIRSFEKINLEFSKGINLIVGPNNAGKSTILRCLQKLQMGLQSLGKEDIRKTFDFAKIHFLLSNINSNDKQMFPPRNAFESQYGDNENLPAANQNLLLIGLVAIN